MLKELHIENIAVIEKADIEFDRGLNVLTGETGSGKSIIIDSLNAVLGNRTSRELVRSGADAARVTAVFETDHPVTWFEDNDLEQPEELIIQRRIGVDGKSSCRVSGMPVTASQLRELTASLIDIHGQNDGLRLLDEKTHLSYLDSFGELGDVLAGYKAEYKKYTGIISEMKSLSMDNDDKLRLSDSLKYQIAELEKAGLKDGEYDQLTSRRELLRNSEKLRENLDTAIGLLSEGDENALSFAENASYYAERASRFAPELEEAAGQLSEACFSLKSAAEILGDFRDGLDFSPEEYDALESRISAIDRLSRKYNRDESALIEYLCECRKKLEDIEFSSDRLAQLEKSRAAQAEACKKAALALRECRREAAGRLETQIVRELSELNMPSVRFKVDFSPIEGAQPFGPDGADEVSFVMSANAGEELGKISRIASGGELSRIMLALKNVFAEHDSVQTMIFDEIDSGVSGISAQRVAEKLYSVSKNRQVMCVSHLPQIASMADTEFLVSKAVSDGRTFTRVDKLDSEGRTREIARLFGGDNITQITLSAAEEQISAARKYKEAIK